MTEDDVTAVHQSLPGKDNLAVYGESLEDVHGISYVLKIDMNRFKSIWDLTLRI